MTDTISKYKPNIDLTDTFKVDEGLSDRDLAFNLWERLQFARKLQDATFLAIGKMLKITRDRKLYKQLDYEDFSSYLESEELSFSREKAYLYIRIYEVFIEQLQLNEMEMSKLGVVRLQHLAPIVRKIENRDEAIQKIEEMSSLRYNDFIRETKNQTSQDGKPNVYWSEEAQKWIVNFWDDKTHLVSLGKWADREL